ncbi:MAG: NMD3-related protein [Promethearchaeota archaeon]
MTRQCPKCGKAQTNAHPFVEGFCTTCYFEQYPLIALRRSPEARICPRCYAYFLKGQWVHQTDQTDEEHFQELIHALLDSLFTPSQPASFEVHLHELPDGPLSKVKELPVEIVAHADDYTYTEQKDIAIPVVIALCNQCQQTAGGYFEAVLQIRSAAGKIAPEQIDQIVEFVNQRLVALNLPSSTLKLSETRGGFDIKCTSGRVCRIFAKSLAEQFGLIQKVSTKVVGRTREGKNLQRDTYSLRFPLIQVGDVIAYKENPFLVTGLRNGRYILINVESSHRENLSPKELSEIDAEFLNDEIQTFQVISVEGDVVQLMSQEDYLMYDIPRPDREMAIGSMVSAIEWKNRLILIAVDEDTAVEKGSE